MINNRTAGVLKVAERTRVCGGNIRDWPADD